MKKVKWEFFYKLCSNKWIVAIKRGLIKAQPFVLIWCLLQIILLIFDNLNIGDNLQIYKAIYEIKKMILLSTSIITIVTISYSLAQKYYKKNKDVDPMIVSMATLVCMVSLNMNNYKGINYGLHNFVYGLTLIIFVIIFTETFLFFYRFHRRYKKLKNNNYDKINNNFANILFSTIITMIVGFAIKHAIIENLLASIPPIRSRNNIITVFIEVILGQLSWFLGENGGNIVYCFSKYYRLILFSNLGGAGGTLALIIALYIVKSRKRKKEISKIAIVASMFNINEPVMYLVPVIFNPIYLIPFILVPLVSIVISIGAIKIGFINIYANDINWALPVFLNGYVLTDSIRGIIVQLVNLLIGIAIYMPFVRIANKVYEMELKDNFDKLKDSVFNDDVGDDKLIERDDDVGDVARTLATDLYEDIYKESEIYLVYQPQVSKESKVVGVEALFRWEHKILGNIPPNISILLATELDIIEDLGNWIIDKSFRELSDINKEINRELEMSINVVAKQFTNNKFSDYIIDRANYYNVDLKNIKLEITESTPLGNDNETKTQIALLNELGVKFAIDDFGQGYNPILYIKKYYIDTIKLDGMLIKDIDKNYESRYIVEMMFRLAKNLGIKIICEFVENESQKLILDQMGDGIYQGYLFSMPLSGDEIIEFIKKN